MATTNHERVGEGLAPLTRGLAPFVERELQAVHGGARKDKASLGAFDARTQPIPREVRSVTLDPVIQTMVDRLARGLHPQRIILFGSHARGTAQRTSDVDLLVILRDVADKRQAAVEMRRALGDLAMGKDILVATADDVHRRGHIVGTTLRRALLQGRVVYEAPPETPSFGLGAAQSQTKGLEVSRHGH